MKKYGIFAILFVSLLFSFYVLLIPNYSSAKTDNLGLGDLNAYEGEKNQGTSNKLKGKANVVFGAIRAVGIVASVVILIAIGIKFMLGSAEEKAEYKKTLMPYLIGAIIVFCGTWLPQIIYNLTKQVF